MEGSGLSSDKLSGFKPPKPKDRKPWAQRRRRFRRGLMKVPLRWAFAALTFGRRTYQPVQLGARQSGSTREFDERWQAVSTVLRIYQARNLLDIGSAEGALIRRAATELGCFAVGVEGTDRLILGEIARLHDDVERASALRAMVSPADIMGLPRFDVVVCLSVVHHVIHAHGLETGRDFIRAMATRADKAIIFEMGTSEEKAGSWRRGLPEAAEGQEAFVTDLLRSCGLTNIRTIAQSVGYRGVPRHIFSAEPSR